MKKLLLFSALAVQLAAAGTQLYAQGVASSPLEAKLALENSLEKRLRLVLAEALGTEDIIVIISADMQEQVQGRKAAVEIMPGVPEKEKVGEVSALRTKVKPEWGNQIRSYVLNPYQLVKDHRTEAETAKVNEVLEGDLDLFIEAELEML